MELTTRVFCRESRIFVNMRAEGALLLVGLLGATAGSALGFSPECGMGSFGLHLRSSSQSCCSARSPAPASLQLAMKEEGAKGDEVFTGGEQLKIMMMRTRLEEENLEVAFASPPPTASAPPASLATFVPVRSTARICPRGTSHSILGGSLLAIPAGKFSTRSTHTAAAYSKCPPAVPPRNLSLVAAGS